MPEFKRNKSFKSKRLSDRNSKTDRKPSRFNERKNKTNNKRSSNLNSSKPRGPNRKDMTLVTCDACGVKCEVPFRPNSDKPIFCSECFRKKPELNNSRVLRNSRTEGFRNNNNNNNNNNNSSNKYNKLLEEINRKLDIILESLGLD